MSGNQQETLTPEEFLEHFGVKGMKWGVRKKSDPSVRQQFRRARAANVTDAQIQRHEKVKAGKGVLGKAGMIDKYTWGRNGRFEGYHDKRIAELERSKERISQGELVARTLILGPQYSRK